MDPLPLSVRDPVRFRLESVRNHLLKLLVRTYERGLDGRITKDDAPGYAVGAKVALALLDRTDPVPKAGDGDRGPITVNVAIITSEAGGAGHAAQANGVAIRFSGGDGDGA